MCFIFGTFGGLPVRPWEARMELERNDPGGECGNEVYEMAPVQIGYMLSGQGKGL